MDIATTVDRVPRSTPDEVNRKIAQQTERNIVYFAAHPEEIEARLAELDREWDIERTLETNAAAVSMISVLFGTVLNRTWLYVPAIVGGFLLQHALKGKCPPLTFFRRMGVRTQTEIEQERYALKALRGDFNKIEIDMENSEQSAARRSKQVLKSVH